MCIHLHIYMMYEGMYTWKYLCWHVFVYISIFTNVYWTTGAFIGEGSVWAHNKTHCGQACAARIARRTSAGARDAHAQRCAFVCCYVAVCTCVSVQVCVCVSLHMCVYVCKLLAQRLVESEVLTHKDMRVFMYMCLGMFMCAWMYRRRHTEKILTHTNVCVHEWYICSWKCQYTCMKIYMYAFRCVHVNVFLLLYLCMLQRVECIFDNDTLFHL